MLTTYLKTNVRNSGLFTLLLIFHVLCTIAAWIFVHQAERADAFRYWYIGADREDLLPGAPLPLREYLLYYINYIPAVEMQLPFWFSFVIYSATGFAGIILLSRLLPKPKGGWSILYLAVMFLPSMHFWTSITGKEPLVFLGTAMVFYGIYRSTKGQIWSISGLILVGIIRPHFAALLLLAWFGGTFFSGIRISLKYILMLLLAMPLLMWMLVSSHWLPDISIASMQRLMQVHHEHLQSTTTYVPLEEYNIFYKFFTFYFRPFPGEISSHYGWLMGIENILLLFISGSGFFAFGRLWFKYDYRPSRFEIIVVVYFIAFALILSLAYSNFGLISRMKIHSMPFMLVVCCHWIIQFMQKRKSLQNINPKPPVF